MSLIRSARNRFLIGALLLSLSLIAVGTGRAAAARPAAGGLTLTVADAPYFIVGSQGGQDGNGSPSDDSNVNVALYLQATSTNSPITNYKVTSIYMPGQPGPTTNYASSPSPLIWNADNYDGREGCEQCIQTGWRVKVSNQAGQSVTKNEGYNYWVVRWNNSDVNSGDGSTGSWTFSPGWSTSTCACADGGSMAKTASAGAYGSYLVNIATSGDHLGLMMATGPTRGRADIYLDGKKVSTVDTYSASDANRIYEWDSAALPKGQHTIKVVNEATGGRPNIYINAMGELHACDNESNTSYC